MPLVGFLIAGDRYCLTMPGLAPGPKIEYVAPPDTVAVVGRYLGAAIPVVGIYDD